MTWTIPGRCYGYSRRGLGNMRKTPLASAISSVLTVGALCATGPVLAQDEDILAADDVVDEIIVTG